MSWELKRLDILDQQKLTDCYDVFKVLRPHLTQANFIERVQRQTNEGYKIAYVEQDGVVLAAAGYRIAHFLAWGKVLYIDDLVTDPNKKRYGLGGALMDWLINEGKALGCDELHLDTGFQRFDAHRLYHNKGLNLSCHHMACKLK